MPEDYSESRRKFIGYAIVGTAGALGLGYAVPLADYLVGTSLKKDAETWSKAGSIAELKVNEPVSLTFSAVEKAGWQEKTVERDVWAVRRPDGTVTVYSPICPHLGCGYRWDPAANHFACPCHASVYDINGKVLGGPAPRDLDTLPSKVEGGILYVTYEKFRVGIPDKVVA